MKINHLKEFLKYIIPFPYHFYFQRNTRMKTSKDVRQDPAQFRIAQNAHFEVYWKVIDKVGFGPALSLYIENEELLRFDFFGPEKGHFHVQTMLPAPASENRLFFNENKVEQQIDRAFFELDKNLHWYTQRHPLKSIRLFNIEKEIMKELWPKIRSLLLLYEEKTFTTLDFHSNKSKDTFHINDKKLNP